MCTCLCARAFKLSLSPLPFGGRSPASLSFSPWTNCCFHTFWHGQHSSLGRSHAPATCPVDSGGASRLLSHHESEQGAGRTCVRRLSNYTGEPVTTNFKSHYVTLEFLSVPFSSSLFLCGRQLFLRSLHANGCKCSKQLVTVANEEHNNISQILQVHSLNRGTVQCNFIIGDAHWNWLIRCQRMPS